MDNLETINYRGRPVFFITSTFTLFKQNSFDFEAFLSRGVHHRYQSRICPESGIFLVQTQIWILSGPDQIQIRVWTESGQNSKIFLKSCPDSVQTKIWYQILIWTESGQNSDFIFEIRPDSIQTKIRTASDSD